MIDKVKLGLVGLNFGAYMAECEFFSKNNDYVCIHAACDLDHSKAESFGQKHHLDFYSDFDRMLANPEIEAIGLFTPPEGRAKMVRKCICAGKHLITTKPFELDEVDALSVLYEARKAGIVVHLNSPGPYSSQDISKISEWREKYALGQTIAARWETYGAYRENADGSWMDSPEKCPVAPIFRLGIYGINELIELIGAVESIHVSKSRIFTGRPTPDNAELTMNFANGAIGSVFASFCIANGMPYPSSMVIHHENGTIVKRQVKEGSTVRNADFKAVELTLNCIHNNKFIEERFEFAPEFRSGAYQWDNFHNAVRNGKLPDGEVAPETIAAGIAVITAMLQAEKTGTSVKISNKILKTN